MCKNSIMLLVTGISRKWIVIYHNLVISYNLYYRNYSLLLYSFSLAHCVCLFSFLVEGELEML